VIKDSLENLNGRQGELDSIIKPIVEKLVQISNKKARLADQWVLTHIMHGPNKIRPNNVLFLLIKRC
jgi:hypothetical protein